MAFDYTYPEHEYYEVGSIEEMRRRIDQLKDLKTHLDNRVIPTLKATIAELKKKKAYSAAERLTGVMNSFKERSFKIAEIVIPSYLDDINSATLEERVYLSAPMKAKRYGKVSVKIPRIKLGSLKRR